jgi:hypothetical protein
VTLTAAFRRPFAFQVAAFRLRLQQLQPTMKWTDVWQEGHDRAFMVAGVMKADILADLAAAVDKAITQGTSLDEFRRDFRKIVAEKGWIGGAGQGTKGGEAWRTRVIYRTNMASTYAAGRWAQLQAAGYPFIIYHHGNSLEPRVHHLAWDGLVLEADHPFWATHAPPNGWGCSCYVSGARTMDAARRLGGKPGKELPDGWQARDPRTGDPKGIDRGWAYPPGGSAVNDILTLKSKLETLPAEPSVALLQEWVRSSLFARWLESPQGEFPLVRLTDAAVLWVGSENRIASLSAETALKQRRQHPELTAMDYAEAQAVVDAATEVIEDSQTSLIFIRAEPGNTGYVLVVKATRSGKGLYVTSFRRLSSRDADRDHELARLRRKQVEK